jgi:hypothetical protein
MGAQTGFLCRHTGFKRWRPCSGVSGAGIGGLGSRCIDHTLADSFLSLLVLNLLSAVVVAGSGTALNNYWLALILLGIGWNFLFVSGTSLLPRAYGDGEPFRVQALNEFLVFGSQAVASLSAG